MSSFAKSLFALLLLCAISLSLTNGISLDDGTQSLYKSTEVPVLSPQASIDVTCAVPQNSCASECDRRCSATSHKNNCLLFCNKCCSTCLCVPPGTFGNKECCPCYNNWKTQEGGPKCP